MIGIGHQVSHGVRAGTIVDMEAAATAIGNAVNSAEQMAGETVREVVANLSGAHAASHKVDIEIAVDGHQVSELDMRRALGYAYQVEKQGETELAHAIPIGYSIDGNKGIEDPRGMYGNMLGVSLHAVTANASAARNLASCIGSSHLQVGSMCVSPYASGLSCLVEDEIQLGCTLIEMGGGTTEIAVFVGGNLVYVDSLPVGGSHVTNDIARGLTDHPGACRTRQDPLRQRHHVGQRRARVDTRCRRWARISRRRAHHIPRSLLIGIIQPRLEETFEMVRGRLEQSGYGNAAGRRRRADRRGEPAVRHARPGAADSRQASSSRTPAARRRTARGNRRGGIRDGGRLAHPRSSRRPRCSWNSDENGGRAHALRPRRRLVEGEFVKIFQQHLALFSDFCSTACVPEVSS